MLDVPEIVPEEARILKRIERMYLREGLGFNDIADHLNAEKIPSATGSHWRGSTISWMLRNPFYCGYIVWGKTRTQRVYDEQRGEFVKRQVEVPAHQRLRKRLGRAPTLEELITNRDALSADDMIVTEGNFDALRSLETQRAIDRERHLRCNHSRATSVSGERPLIFSGILTCDTCGGAMVSAGRRKSHDRLYYRCPTARDAGETVCDNRAYTREIHLFHNVMGILRELIQEGDVDAHLPGGRVQVAVGRAHGR